MDGASARTHSRIGRRPDRRASSSMQSSSAAWARSSGADAGHDQRRAGGRRLQRRPGPLGQRESAQRATGHGLVVRPCPGDRAIRRAAMRLQVEQHCIRGRGQCAAAHAPARPPRHPYPLAARSSGHGCAPGPAARPADQVRAASALQRRRISSARPGCAGPVTGLRSAAVRTLTADSGAGSPPVPLRRSEPSGARSAAAPVPSAGRRPASAQLWPSAAR